jgi:hypothetical protein
LAAAFVCAVAPARAAVLIEVDKSTQRMAVSVDGVPRWNFAVSTGRRGYDTPSGSYRAFRMEADHYSKEWDDAPMPHSIFFTKIGHAIHGSFDIKRIGSPASHGCVRLAPENAAMLYALVQEQGVLNTTVVLGGQIPVNANVARDNAAPLPLQGDPYAQPPADVPDGRLDTYTERMRRQYQQRYSQGYTDDRVPPSYGQPATPPPPAYRRRYDSLPPEYAQPYYRRQPSGQPYYPQYYEQRPVYPYGWN